MNGPIRSEQRGAGPAVPPVTHIRQHPCAEVSITGGLLGHWQETNRTASIPLGIRKLDEAGNYDNLRLAAGESVDAEYRGPVYMDSDIYKMLETAGWELGRREDPQLRAFLDEASDLIEAAQEADGYLNSYYQVVRPGERYTRLGGSHETYTAGHLIQAAVAAFRGAGDDRLLRIARPFADHLVRVFLRDRYPHLDGHPGIETALVELSRLTGEPDYLQLARRFVDDRGHGLVGDDKRGRAYFQDAVPVRQMSTLAGHAVRALYLEAGIVDVAIETGDRALLESSVGRWRDMLAAKTAITGGLGVRQLGEAFGERYELPPDQAYNETCAAIASIHWSWRLLLATGDRAYADLIERTLYNAFAASFSADGLEFFKGNPLLRRSDHAEAIGDPKVRGGWFWSACCPPNVTRLLSSLHHYLATTTPDSIQLHQYAPATVTAPVSGQAARLSIATDYPWDGTVTVTVAETPSTAWTLALRVPSWAGHARLRLGDEPLSSAPDRTGYLRVTRPWRPGDTLTLDLDLDMAPRLTRPDPRVDALRGCVAVERGPLVYCFEQADQPPATDLQDTALPLDPARQTVAHCDLPRIGTTRTIRTPALARTAPPADFPYSPGGAGSEPRAITATAIPYFQWANRDDRAMRIWMPIEMP